MIMRNACKWSYVKFQGGKMEFIVGKKTRSELISAIVELQQENRRLHNLLETAHNSDYAKCLESAKEELYSDNPGRVYSREEVIDIIRQHFA